MNLANKLTIIRMLLVPIMVIIPFFNIQGQWLGIPITYWIINFIFIIASITDKLDGYIARSRNEVTTFGKFLDPLADKILVLASLIILVEYKKIPSWIPIIILTREFIVSGYRLIAVEKGGQVIAASIWGKMKTGWQMSTCMFMTCDIVRLVEGFGWPSVVVTVWHIVELIAMYGALVLTIISMIDYFYKNRNCFSTKE